MSKEPPEPDLHEMAMQYALAVHGHTDELYIELTGKVLTMSGDLWRAEDTFVEMCKIFGEYRTHKAISEAEDILKMVIPNDDSS